MSAISSSGNGAWLTYFCSQLVRRTTSNQVLRPRHGCKRPFCFSRKDSDIGRSSGSINRPEALGHPNTTRPSIDANHFSSSNLSRDSSSATRPQQSQFGSLFDLINDVAASEDPRSPRIRKIERNGLSEKVKSLMRHVPHPVAVITSTDISVSPEGAPSGWRGATVSSFNTVTVHPKPIVSFNIKKLSSTYDAIKSSGLFNVHLFTCSGRAIKIAHKFASGNASSPFHDPNGVLANFAKRQPNVPGARSQEVLQLGRQPPVIDSSPRPQFLLRCENLPKKAVEIEDHMVIFGEVEEAFAELHEIKELDVFLYYVNGQYMPTDESRMFKK